jgi:hypothetical protein
VGRIIDSAGFASTPIRRSDRSPLTSGQSSKSPALSARHEKSQNRNTPTATKNDCKAFATNQTVAMHCLDDPLEYIRERISLAEALVACTRNAE